MKKDILLLLILTSYIISFGQKDSISERKTDIKNVDTLMIATSKRDVIASVNFEERILNITKEYGNDTLYYVLLLHVTTKEIIRQAIDIAIKEEYITAKLQDCYLFTKTIKLLPNKKISDTITEQLVFAVFNNEDSNNTDVVYRITATIDKMSTNCIINILKPNEMHKLNYNNPYNFIVNIGSNFDFSDGLKANSLFAKVSIFNPNLLKNRIGIYAGMYQNTYISKDSTTNRFAIEILNERNDTISFVKQSISYKSNSKINNISLFLGIPVRLTMPKKEFSLYWAPEFEILKINESITKEYNVYEIDTMRNMSISFYRGLLTVVQPINLQQKEFINQYYIKHFGFANFILILEDNRKSFFLSATIWGLGKISWEPESYYQFKFDISEKKYGLTLGGEFRGFYGRDPYIGIHMSKLFDISKLVDYK